MSSACSLSSSTTFVHKPLPEMPCTVHDKGVHFSAKFEFIAMVRRLYWFLDRSLSPVDSPHRCTFQGHGAAPYFRCWSRRRRSAGHGESVVVSIGYKGTKALFPLPFIFSRLGASILIDTSFVCAAWDPPRRRLDDRIYFRAVRNLSPRLSPVISILTERTQEGRSRPADLGAAQTKLE